jgi:hypothetical protein
MCAKGREYMATPLKGKNLLFPLGAADATSTAMAAAFQRAAAEQLARQNTDYAQYAGALGYAPGGKGALGSMQYLGLANAAGYGGSGGGGMYGGGGGGVAVPQGAPQQAPQQQVVVRPEVEIDYLTDSVLIMGKRITRKELEEMGPGTVAEQLTKLLRAGPPRPDQGQLAAVDQRVAETKALRALQREVLAELEPRKVHPEDPMEARFAGLLFEDK